MVDRFDGTIKLDELLAPFKIDSHPSLVGKPKMFILQACRGYKLDKGVGIPPLVLPHDPRARRIPTDACSTVPGYVPFPSNSARRIPSEADFLFGYSTAPGFVSFRNDAGSHYIQAFARRVERAYLKNQSDARPPQERHVDLLALLLGVSYDVAHSFTARSDSPTVHGSVQAPAVEGTITRSIKFPIV